ncbi:hypothetical protein DFH07DRAFT_1064424 [Mycena maculata]|uniref:Uncharacterized protein n=1 Tax=Mycena maculata TaxID=230809 RepID=A0AAD7IBA7_9AGAR|nr:hypothetical protein DFH07DRAFT_1064424 [Mycena maculata]
MRSVVFHRRNWKWPIVSLFLFFLAGVQTSGWSTLLTPVKVTDTIIGNLTWTGIQSRCPAQNGMNFTNAFTMQDRNLMMMLACGPSDNYTLIFVSDGLYSPIPITVCEVTPKITAALVDYTPGLINVVNPNMTGAVMDPIGPTGFSAVQTLFGVSQATTNNVIGNFLMMMIQEFAEDTDSEVDDILEPLEEFIRGVMEYSGSVFRACVSTNTSFSDRIPPNMSIPTNGTLFTETLGWSYGVSITRWVLVPGTLIAFCTICIVSVALYRHVGDLPREPNQFDPSNPLHLMVAAAAGGLNNTFRGLSNEDMEEGEKLAVFLGSISGKGPALVRADQYTPVFADAFSPRSAEELVD